MISDQSSFLDLDLEKECFDLDEDVDEVWERCVEDISVSVDEAEADRVMRF